jgi:signal peptidase II
MNKPELPRISESGIRWLWIPVLVIVADQLSKWWISSNLALTSAYTRGDEIVVLPVFKIIYTVNPGAAWSLGAGSSASRWLFSILAIGVSAALVVWLRRLALASHALLVAGLSLILGGAIGNVIDRLRLGHVTDFLLAHWGDAQFPAFNVADSAITVGAGLVILDAILDGRRERQAARAAKHGESPPS